MAIGPGKYDQACSMARVFTGARAVALIVLGGEHGSGFSVQTENPRFLELLPDMLRQMAMDIEQDMERDGR
jgi:hypothetical protein